jgi:hypothetical protein
MLITSFDLKRVLAHLEPYVLGNLLASEWQPMKSKTYPYVVNHREANRLGMELFRKFGFMPQPEWGVCKVVFTHETAVIKIPIHETYADITDAEIADINTRWPDPEQKKYFAYTLAVGNGISVQERCRIMTPGEYINELATITGLARDLGLWDYHDGNVGYELVGEQLKFFDVQRKEHLCLISEIESTRERARVKYLEEEAHPLDEIEFKAYVESVFQTGV